MRLNSKVFRRATRIIEKGLKHRSGWIGSIDARFSCNTVFHLSDRTHKNVYQDTFDLHCVSVVAEIEGLVPPAFQSQLHRCLMLDLMAEMIEQGDVK